MKVNIFNHKGRGKIALMTLYYHQEEDSFNLISDNIYDYTNEKLHEYDIMYHITYEEDFPTISYYFNIDENIYEQLEKIFLIYHDLSENILNQIIYDKNDLITKFNEDVAYYYKNNNKMISEINDETIIKFSKYFSINGNNNIEMFIERHNYKINKLDILIKKYQDVSNFAKNYIRNKKINKINES